MHGRKLAGNERGKEKQRGIERGKMGKERRRKRKSQTGLAGREKPKRHPKVLFLFPPLAINITPQQRATIEFNKFQIDSAAQCCLTRAVLFLVLSKRINRIPAKVKLRENEQKERQAGRQTERKRKQKQTDTQDRKRELSPELAENRAAGALIFNAIRRVAAAAAAGVLGVVGTGE